MGRKRRKKKKRKIIKSKAIDYPKTVAECIDDKMKYRKATLDAVKEFRGLRPWKGTLRERRNKIVHLHRVLCEIYAKDIGIAFVPEAESQYIPEENIIVLKNLSVVTFLHEFAHTLGKDEKDACRWSLNLFKRCFPKSFAKSTKVGHLLIRKKILTAISDAVKAVTKKKE